MQLFQRSLLKPAEDRNPATTLLGSFSNGLLCMTFVGHSNIHLGWRWTTERHNYAPCGKKGVLKPPFRQLALARPGVALPQAQAPSVYMYLNTVTLSALG